MTHIIGVGTTLMAHEIEHLEIQISADGKKVWINTEIGCICRVQGINRITINDCREGGEDGRI